MARYAQCGAVEDCLLSKVEFQVHGDGKLQWLGQVRRSDTTSSRHITQGEIEVVRQLTSSFTVFDCVDPLSVLIFHSKFHAFRVDLADHRPHQQS